MEGKIPIISSRKNNDLKNSSEKGRINWIIVKK